MANYVKPVRYYEQETPFGKYALAKGENGVWYGWATKRTCFGVTWSRWQNAGEIQRVYHTRLLHESASDNMRDWYEYKIYFELKNSNGGLNTFVFDYTGQNSKACPDLRLPA